MKPKRFVFWRRAPEELYSVGVEKYGEVISTLEQKIKEAKEIVEQGQYETVMVLEIKKVIKRKKVVNPIVVQDF